MILRLLHCEMPSRRSNNGRPVLHNCIACLLGNHFEGFCCDSLPETLRTNIPKLFRRLVLRCSKVLEQGSLSTCREPSAGCALAEFVVQTFQCQTQCPRTEDSWKNLEPWKSTPPNIDVLWRHRPHSESEDAFARRSASTWPCFRPENSWRVVEAVKHSFCCLHFLACAALEKITLFAACQCLTCWAPQ